MNRFTDNSSPNLEHKKPFNFATETDISHHIKGIRPALSVMESEGFSAIECLKGSGISLADLEQGGKGISLQQELAFYRRLLTLTDNPELGLKLGKAYRLENYGMFGYAILSAQTLGEALKIAKDFGPLSFSHFILDFSIKENKASIIMRQNKALDSNLMTLYEDRDCTAIIYGSRSALGHSFPIKSIQLMHSKPANPSIYEDHFQCPVEFGKPQMCIHFTAEVLTTPMPLRDAETSQYCQQQCQQLLEKITHNTSLFRQVKTILDHDPEGFPSFSELCKIVDLPERSARRKLSEEGYKFQDLLNQARFERAKCLLATDLSLTEIAQKLSYSETGNFSHAFKRWSGMSPKTYRECLLSQTPKSP